MYFTPEKKATLSPFARWVADYAERHGLTVTRLARRAGLSAEALLRHCRDKAARSATQNPRAPTLETCLALAVETNTPLFQILALVVDVPDAVTGDNLPVLDAPGAQLVDIYQNLPRPLQQALLATAHAFDQATETDAPRT